MSSTRILPRLGSLSEKLVNAVADHLDNADLMEFRITSKTIYNHLNPNPRVRKRFEELECPFTSLELWDLHKFMVKPLASEVKSLKLLKTDDTDQLDMQLCVAGETPGVSIRGNFQVIDNPKKVRQHLLERPQRLFAEMVNDHLPNLKLVDFCYGVDMAQAQSCTLRDPKAKDFVWMAEALARVKRCFNFRMSYENGALCFPWAVDKNGNYGGTHGFWFEGYSHEVPHPIRLKYRNLRNSEDYFSPCLTDAIPILHGHAVKTLSLNRCAFSLKDVRRLSEAQGHIEVLIMTECEVYSCRAGEEGQEEEHLFFTDPNSRLRKTLRKFAISTCFTPSVPWVRVFKAMRKYNELEMVLFESICTGEKTVRFDWDGNGRYDDGSRLQMITQQLGMKGSLSKMIKRYEETTETSHLKPKPPCACSGGHI